MGEADPEWQGLPLPHFMAAPGSLPSPCTIPFHLVLHMWRMDAQCLTRSHQAACSKARMLPSAWLAFVHGLKGNTKASGWPISDVATYVPDGPSPEEQGLGEMLSQLGDSIAKQRGAREEGLSFLFVCVNLDPACRGFVDGTSLAKLGSAASMDLHMSQELPKEDQHCRQHLAVWVLAARIDATRRPSCRLIKALPPY